MTLGALRGVELDDEVLLQRYRFEIGRWAMSIRRRYRVGETVTVDEARHVLEIETAPGDIIEVTGRHFDEIDVWLALIDPAAAVLKRTQALTGVDASELARRFATELDVDLERRTLGGTPWRSLQVRNGWMDRTVVEQARENTEISLADAQRFAPDAKLGHTISLPSPIRAEPLAWEPEQPLHEPPAHEVHSLDEEQVEQLRSCAVPVETPATLARFDLGPLRSFYPGGAHGVLYLDITTDEDEARWRELDKAATKTGYRPVILHGEQQGNPPVDDLVVARFAWKQDSNEGMQAGSHPADSPEVVLAEVERVDVDALLAAGGNPSYPDWRLTSGKAVAPRPRRPLLASYRRDHARLLLVPTDAAWKTIAYVPVLTTSGEATPSLAQAAAVSRAWEHRWGVRVAAIAPAVIEWIAPPLELDLAATKRLATEHHAFSPEGYEDTTFEQRAAALVMAGTWYAWWD